MNEIWHRCLRKGLQLANSIWWLHDQTSYEVVDGKRLRGHDYRAAGCMRLVRPAKPDFESTLAGQFTVSPRMARERVAAEVSRRPLARVSRGLSGR
jgi:hypothetical protein